MIYEPQESPDRPGRQGRERELAAAIVGMAIVGALVFQFSCRGVAVGPARWLCPNADMVTDSDAGESDDGESNEETDEDQADDSGDVDAGFTDPFGSPEEGAINAIPTEEPAFSRPVPTMRPVQTQGANPFGVGGGDNDSSTSEPGDGSPTLAIPSGPGDPTRSRTPSSLPKRATGYPGGDDSTNTPTPTVSSPYPGG